LDTLKELILSVTDIDIFVLFADSNAGGTDSVVGGVDDIPEDRRKAGAAAQPCPLPKYRYW